MFHQLLSFAHDVWHVVELRVLLELALERADIAGDGLGKRIQNELRKTLSLKFYLEVRIHVGSECIDALREL